MKFSHNFSLQLLLPKKLFDGYKRIHKCFLISYSFSENFRKIWEIFQNWNITSNCKVSKFPQENFQIFQKIPNSSSLGYPQETSARACPGQNFEPSEIWRKPLVVFMLERKYKMHSGINHKFNWILKKNLKFHFT